MLIIFSRHGERGVVCDEALRLVIHFHGNSGLSFLFLIEVLTFALIESFKVLKDHYREFVWLRRRESVTRKLIVGRYPAIQGLLCDFELVTGLDYRLILEIILQELIISLQHSIFLCLNLCFLRLPSLVGLVDL